MLFGIGSFFGFLHFKGFLIKCLSLQEKLERIPAMADGLGKMHSFSIRPEVFGALISNNFPRPWSTE
jgi:hypothetical protein